MTVANLKVMAKGATIPSPLDEELTSDKSVKYNCY